MLTHRRIFPASLTAVALCACSAVQSALTPAFPLSDSAPDSSQIPDSILNKAIGRAELIVLATPVELVSQHGFLTPHFQLGAKETWYDVKLVVDSIVKGKLKRAKHPDLGALPAWLTPPPSFGRLGRNEIVVQYPAVTSRSSDWAAAVPLVPGETAVFFFRRCYYCLPITGMATSRGYYKASPLVAIGRESKLRPDQWARVSRLTRCPPGQIAPRRSTCGSVPHGAR
jgi:hypothetical protein